jgi:alpha-tubulin suppressor-like RCC1 family protein
MDFTLLTKADGTLWTWGDDIYSGDGTTTARAYPVQVLRLTNVKAVGDGAESLHNLVLQNDGTVWGWGSNLYGDLGILSPPALAAPFPLVGLASVKAVSSQYENSAAIRSDGSVYVWGNNSVGQLGNGSLVPTQTYIPVRFLDNGDAVAIAVGQLYTLVLNRDGSVYGAGENNTGQLGNNSFVDASVPKQVVGVGAVGMLNLGVSTGP